MNNSELFKIQIPDILGGVSSYEDNMVTDYISIWDEIIKMFSSIDRRYPDCTVRYEFNWSSVRDILLKDMQYNISIQEFLTLTLEEQDKYNKELLNGYDAGMIECKVTILNKEIEDHLVRLYSAYYLESFLYDLFLVINLAEPGCFNLYNTSFVIDDRHKIEIDLISSLFVDSMWNSKTSLWPMIRHLNLLETWEWYTSLDIGVRQVAHSRTERAIFSLFHICQDQGASPTTIIWLSESLEALYDTPSALINQLLRDRIMLFLGKPEQNYNRFKKQINEFYNLRSRFVHGDFPVLHPSNNEVIDSKVETITEELFSGYEFGFAILVSTLQNMVINKFKNLKFSEVFFGETNLTEK